MLSIIFTIVASFVIIPVVSVVIYRLYFHPLASVPGPRLAALEKLHKQYGRIIRIGPNEVHIDDPEYFDELYGLSNKLDKDEWYYAFIGSPDAMFGTSDADLHRARRKAMSHFFGSAAIPNIQTVVREKVLKLCNRLEDFRRKKAPVNMTHAFRSLASDSVSEYCFPRGLNLLDSADLGDDYHSQNRSLGTIGTWHRFIPIIIPLFMMTPRWVVKLSSSEGQLLFFDFQQDLAVQATNVVKNRDKPDESVLSGIVTSNAIPESDKTIDRITQEARMLIAAGTETTGAALDKLIFRVISDPTIHENLKEELSLFVKKHGESALTEYNTLKSLPWLTAIINELLRLDPALSGRLPRIDRKTSRTYQSYVLPPGTIMSVGIDMHFSEDIYPDALKFKPERWMTDASKGQEKYWAPFGRGTRTCMGKEFAFLTMYLVVANFFYRFEPRLHETSVRDITTVYDLFSGFPAIDSKGVRVMLD